LKKSQFYLPCFLLIRVKIVQLILADDYSKLAIGTFPGKYKETEIYRTAEAEGIEEETEKEVRQKLFSCWKFIQKGEVGRAWCAWNIERASRTATEEGFMALSENIIDRQED